MPSPAYRTVIVGIAPGKAGHEGQPLSAIAPQSSGRKIADMIGVSWSAYMQTFDRVNICPFPQKGTIKVKDWQPAAENLAGSILRQRRVIMLGPNVAECFGINRAVYNFGDWKINNSAIRGIGGFRIGMSMPFDWMVIPHPSGRNLWYNNQYNKELISNVLKDEYERSRSET